MRRIAPRQAQGGAGLVLALAIGACQFDPYPNSYARTRPTHEELVGTWIATAGTLKSLAARGLGTLRPTIVLRADGNVRIVDVPDDWTGPDTRSAKPPVYESHWKLYQDNHARWGIGLDEPGHFCVGCLMVLNDAPPRLLVLRYGDPDEGRGYEFERAVEQRVGADGA